MTLFIIGLSVTLIINALLLLLVRKHFIYNLKRHNELTRGLFELQKEFTDYQVNQKRYNNKDKYTCRNALHYRTEERFTRSW